MIPLLECIFHGKLAPYGETLSCMPPPTGTEQVDNFIKMPSVLESTLRRHASYLGTQDLRPAASAWLLSYCSALLPPVVAAATLLQYQFPVSAEETSVLLNTCGKPIIFYIGNHGKFLPDSSTVDRYQVLLWEHLAPLITTLGQLAHVSPKLLWGNVARRLEPILEQALAISNHAPITKEDFDQLLCRPFWPKGRPNPLFHRQRELRICEEDTTAMKLHRQCCLYYLLPNEGYCEVCPLAPVNRPVKDKA